MASASKPTLESIVTRYRREAARGGASSPELEIRFQEVDYANFAAIHEALLRGSAGPAGAITQMVSAIMDVRQSRGEGLQRHLRAMRIREIFFADGKRSRERYAHKEPLLIPARVPASAGGIAYTVALSAERPEQPFSADEGAVIRVKARVSFPLALAGSSELTPELRWRVDMTVTRQIMGSDADTALPQIIGQMFRTAPPMTPANMLSALRLDEATSASAASARELYRYEVEVEFEGPADSRDLVRPADVTAAAEAVLRLANPEHVREAALQAEVYRAAKYAVRAQGYLRRFAHELGLKRLLPQALAITRADYRAIYPPAGMYLTDKADGKRALALAHDGQGFIAADALLTFAGAPAGPADTVVDGELVVSAEGEPHFYAFDVLAVAGESVALDGFERRLARLAEAVEILRAAGVPASAKAYAHLASGEARALERAFRETLQAARPYATDGLILVEPGKPYDETANYKWKPARDNTIDFLARRAPPSVLGREPFVDRPGHKVHFLFVGIAPGLYEALGMRRCPGYADLFRGANSGSYFPVQFAPSDAPLAYVYQHPDDSALGEVDGKVVEGRCRGRCAAAGGGATLVDWEMVRVREDRRRELASKQYYGNDFYTAELIWLNYIDPFPAEQLWEGPSLDYFMRPKAGVYRAQTAVLSYVKTQRILALGHAAWVVDVGAGKGQDLGRYLDAEVQHLVAVDQDRAALAELVRRKYSYARQARGPAAGPAADSAERPRGARARTATTVHVLAADAAAPHAETLRKLEALGLQSATADALVCNLAVHYFLGSVEGLRNFAALARGVVKVGGQVVVTALFGEAVHALFAAERVPEGGSWDVRENEALKYSLRRLYASETLEAAGQRIGVLLPFSEGRYYEEFLVNTRALTAELAARGFSRTVAASVAKHIPAFEARDRATAALLTPGDRRYLGLYGELCFQRDR